MPGSFPFLDSRYQFNQRKGAYRLSVGVALVASQAAASRLLSLRNAFTVNTGVTPQIGNYLAVTMCRVTVLQTGNHTAALVGDIRLRINTGFTVDDNTNQVALTPGKLDSRYAAATAVGQCVTVTGAANGMTGGTWANGSTIDRHPIHYQATMPTAAQVPIQTIDFIDTKTKTHPLYLAPAEGISIENGVVFGAAGTASVYMVVEWEEFVPLGL